MHHPKLITLEDAAALLWYRADHHVKNIYKRTPLEDLQDHLRIVPCSGLLGDIQALETVVPIIKKLHTAKYYDVLTKHMPRDPLKSDPARIAMDYVGKPSWGKRAWRDISVSIAPVD